MGKHISSPFFSADLRTAFNLGHGAFGTVYALATLTSAALMLPCGQLIDRLDLRPYSAGICASMVLACLLMATVPTASVVFLYLAILMLRLSGQGLMSHTAVTAMARYFDHGRGRAIALASLGHSAGEAIFPLTAVALLVHFTWRETWMVLGAVLAVGLVPLVLWLLRGHGARHAALLGRTAAIGANGSGGRQWSRGEVLRDRAFYLLLPSILAPSFINTGVFFNQVHLVESKGWTMGLFASGFVVYAAATIAAALAGAPLVDRLGALHLFPYVLLPLAAGLAILAIADAPIVAIAYMLMAGLSAGCFGTVSSALWAEAYGILNLGAIRAMAASLMVLSTALSPALMGWLIDGGMSMEAIAFGCLRWVLAASALIPLAIRERRRISGPDRG